MKRTLGMVSKFILIFSPPMSNTNVSFSGKKEIESKMMRMRCVGPYLALSVFIWHYYSLGNKFWHAKISDNSNIKFNQ